MQLNLFPNAEHLLVIWQEKGLPYEIQGGEGTCVIKDYIKERGNRSTSRRLR